MHGLSYAVVIYCPAVKVVIARAQGFKQSSPMDDCVGNRPSEGFAYGVELARDRR